MWVDPPPNTNNATSHELTWTEVAFHKISNHVETWNPLSFEVMMPFLGPPSKLTWTITPRKAVMKKYNPIT